MDGKQAFVALKKENIDLRKTENYLKIINQFAVNISTLNTIHDIVWAIAKYAIAGMGFEDCVVYLRATNEQHLIQVATYGPKNPVDYEIKDPITIRIGTGIVGSVAQTGMAERIDDTLHDPRYIVDDEFRRSELAVPIIHEEIVLGVIDSEHSKPSFYTQADEEILNTIALLVAPRIAYLQATQSEMAASKQQLLTRTMELKDALQSLKKTQQALIKAKEDAEAASRAKSAFISKMSHELRSPLTSILGYSQLLERYGAGNQKILKAASIIEAGSHHLSTLINDILIFSKLETDTYTIEAKFIALESFLENISELVCVQAQQKGLGFKLTMPTPLPSAIFVDPNRLRQVLINLIINGIKFTQKGSVELEVTAKEESEEGIATLQFAIIDSGIGIAEKDLSRIFLPFEQLNSRMGQSKGTGLGLTIAQQILHSMDSVIEVESHLGQGSRFSFLLDLPFSMVFDDKGVPQLNREIVGYEGAKLTILIVEDLLSIRSFLAHTLTMLGFSILEATNGVEAIKKLQMVKPTLIFMDTFMPKMDGATATRKIRRMVGYEDVPIIAMSAHVAPEDVEHMLENGANRFLAKPLMIYDIALMLEELLDLEWITE